jgi:hypothetical protein
LAVQQEIHLGLTIDQISQTGRADGLEAALGGRQALDRPRPNQFANTLKLVPAKVAQTEKIAKQTARGLSDYDRIRPDQRLQASCKVRRVTDDSMLPELALAAVADHHYAGGDANADRERFSSTRFEPRNSGNDIKPCSYGSLGIVLVRAGIAKIGQYPVSPEIGKETVIG